MKIIEVIADTGHHDTILSIAEQYNIEDVWFGENNEDGRVATRLLVQPENRQPVIQSSLFISWHQTQNLARNT